jgi:UDPglucose--hexose-1-phosphate uridylyltransferase
MPSIRRHPISGDPVLYAPERAARPHAFGDDEAEGRCPFCPGNESDTPPEITRTGEPWRVRVFPNKFPAVDGHEIIVESPAHDAEFETIDHGAEVIDTYAARYRHHARTAAFVALFKNHGARAGSSLAHMHSQVMPLPFIPPAVERQRHAYGRASSCPLCKAPHADLVISENDSFRRFAPFAPSHVWEQWIAPKRHMPDIAALTRGETESLTAILQEATRAARSVTPAYNVVWYLFPNERAAHSYIAVIPRVTPMAGFEVGTGTFIDIIDPAATARRFR